MRTAVLSALLNDKLPMLINGLHCHIMHPAVNYKAENDEQERSLEGQCMRSEDVQLSFQSKLLYWSTAVLYSRRQLTSKPESTPATISSTEHKNP